MAAWPELDLIAEGRSLGPDAVPALMICGVMAIVTYRWTLPQVVAFIVNGTVTEAEIGVALAA